VSDAEGYQALAEADEQAAARDHRRDLSSRLRWPLMISGPIVMLAIVAWFVLTSGRYQSTDDAYVQISRARISPSIDARVLEVAVQANQPVKAGQVLVRLDPAEFTVAEAEAQALLATARLQAGSAAAVYRQRLIDQFSARSVLTFYQREAKRQRDLAALGVSTQIQSAEADHQVDVVRREIALADQQVAAALSEIGGAEGLPIDRQPRVMTAQAALDRARLNRSYTVLTAPVDGVVTKVEQVQPGDRVSRSQPLFWLVSGRPWVEANFKEDQLAHMRVGQPVTIRVDAYDHDLKGHIASFSPGTGGSFALLPAENATGNWVKVVQRVPVRISFDGTVPPLSAGLSAHIKVDLRGESTPR
jgi:membrane fusion protein (multidrug efflux system)